MLDDQSPAGNCCAEDDDLGKEEEDSRETDAEESGYLLRLQQFEEFGVRRPIAARGSAIFSYRGRGGRLRGCGWKTA